jgi:sRNA-binding regulator protein Hfq
MKQLKNEESSQYKIRGKGQANPYLERLQKERNTITIYGDNGEIIEHYIVEPRRVELAPDVYKHFSSEKAVNEALRSLIKSTKHNSA